MKVIAYNSATSYLYLRKSPSYVVSVQLNESERTMKSIFNSYPDLRDEDYALGKAIEINQGATQP